MTPPPSDTPAPRRSTRGAAPPRGEDERVTADAKNLNDGKSFRGAVVITYRIPGPHLVSCIILIP